jgi:hypothetical protein
MPQRRDYVGASVPSLRQPARRAVRVAEPAHQLRPRARRGDVSIVVVNCRVELSRVSQHRQL